MTVWLVRAGKHGEFEQKFLQETKSTLLGMGFQQIWER
jgi:hypothetical protein